MYSVSVDNDCNKRGQTSRPVVGTEIQTSCNFKANLPDCYYILACVYCLFCNVLLESPFYHMVLDHSYIAVPSSLDLLLHKDFLHPPSSSKSSTRPCSTTEPNKSTEHSTIQKVIVHCNMAATDAGRLLSSPRCSGGVCDKWWTFCICLSRLVLYNHFSLLKLVFEPDSLLFEVRRSQTSSDGHNQTSALLLFFELVLVDQHYKKGECLKKTILEVVFRFPKLKFVHFNISV